MNNSSTDKMIQILSEGTLIDKAVKEAVREAVLHHAQRGFPVAEWRDGRVVWVSPEAIFARLHNRSEPET